MIYSPYFKIIIIITPKLFINLKFRKYPIFSILTIKLAKINCPYIWFETREMEFHLFWFFTQFCHPNMEILTSKATWIRFFLHIELTPFVNRHHHNGRWEARIGRVLGNKYLYLGTFGNLYIPTISSIDYIKSLILWILYID